VIVVSAEELVVAIEWEGVGETQQDLEGVERSMENTADAAGESAAQLEGFSERFAGAMSAAVTALAVGAAGLLSKVPVLGETFAGLVAIVDAVAFQMDSVLRPVLAPLTNAFFDIADAIFNADGIFGDIIGTIASLVSIATVVITAIAAVGAQVGVFGSIWAGVVTILTKVATVIAGIVGAIVGIKAAILIAIAAIVAFAAAYALNLGGVRDKTNEILGKVWSFFVGLASDLSEWAGGLASDAFGWGKDAVGDLLNGIKETGGGITQWFSDLATDLSEWAGDIASDAFQWGKDIINRLIDGIASAISSLKDKLNELKEIAPSVNVDTSSLSGGSSGRVGGGTAAPSGSTGRSSAGRAFGDTSGGAQIDGRQLSESTGRYRSDPGRRRGL